MASRIQGITVEIGGDTTKLSKALEGVNKTIKGTQSGLKDVNKLLKLEEGRILIFRKTLDALGKPSHYRFLYNASTHEIAVQACKPDEAGSHRVGKLDETNSCEIKCIAFVRMIYKDAGWNKRWSYRLTGRAFPAQRLVSFQIEDAAPIENGRVMPENVSPTVALCRAESLPAENNPTSPVKRDSGAV